MSSSLMPCTIMDICSCLGSPDLLAGGESGASSAGRPPGRLRWNLTESVRESGGIGVRVEFGPADCLNVEGSCRFVRALTVGSRFAREGPTGVIGFGGMAT